MWLLREPGGKTAVVDPSEAGPVAAKLDALGVKPDYILNTHHHWDHTGCADWESCNRSACFVAARCICCRSEHSSCALVFYQSLAVHLRRGNEELKKAYGLTIVGPKADKDRIPVRKHALR